MHRSLIAGFCFCVAIAAVFAQAPSIVRDGRGELIATVEYNAGGAVARDPVGRVFMVISHSVTDTEAIAVVRHRLRELDRVRRQCAENLAMASPQDQALAAAMTRLLQSRAGQRLMLSEFSAMDQRIRSAIMNYVPDLLPVELLGLEEEGPD